MSELNVIGLVRSLVPPELPEGFDRIRPVPLIMVITEQKQVFDLPFSHDLSAQLNPMTQVFGPVYDGLVPRHRHGFDLLAVPQPTDICEVGRDEVKRLLQFPRTGHERGVRQSERHTMLPQRFQ